MVTEEDKQEIIDRAVERALLILPETIGNLMTQHAALAKLNSEFYKEYPEFREHKESVVAAMEKVDGENPLLKYEDKLKKAVPEIRERINLLKRLDMATAPTSPNRDFSKFDIPQVDRVSNNGAL